MTVRFSRVSNDPIETQVAVIDIRQEAPKAGRHLLTDVGLNVLVALPLRKPPRELAVTPV